MAEPIDRQTTVVSDWPGLFTNTGLMAGDSPPGNAAEQVNLTLYVPGQLGVRPGFRKVLFDEEP